MFRRGLYALSADPVHLGHLDVIRQAAEQCESLVVIVANNDEKRGSYLFSLNARRRLVKGVLGGWLPRTEIIAEDRLLTDVFIEQGCDVLFRGIRSPADEAFERQQLSFHERILPGITDKARFIHSIPDLAHVSSSLVKAFAARHVDTSSMVPPMVKVALEATLHGQCFVGITGCMAMGKTYVAEEICKQIRVKGHPATHVSFDVLLRQLYMEESQGAQIIRDEIDRMLPGVLTDDRKQVDLGKMKAAISAADPDIVNQIHRMTYPHVFRLFREEITGKKGLILVEWAQLAEDHMLSLVNNRVIVVDSPDRDEMLAKRGVPKDFFEKFASLQWSTDQKVTAIEQEIAQSGYGKLFRYTNRMNQPFDIAFCDALIALLPVSHT